MGNVIRATVFMIGGLCCFAFALLFGLFVWQHLSGSAGLHFFALSVSSGGVLIGLIRVLGFSAGAGLCFVVGVGLCAHGLVPPVRQKE